MSKIAHQDVIWKNGSVLLTIARYKHLETAANVLNMDRSTLSRRVRAVEQALGYRIFHSDKGQLSPTEQGVALIDCLENAEREINKASINDDVQSLETEATVKISFPPHLVKLMSPNLIALKKRYPKANIQLDVSYQLVDMEMQHADIALRISKTEPKYPLIAEKIADLHGAYYKSRNTKLEDIVYVCSEFEEIPNEHARALFEFYDVVKATDYHTQIELLKHGGLGRTIHELAKDESELELAHQDMWFAGWKLWLVNHSSTKYIPHIKFSSDFLSRALREQLVS